LITLKMPVKAFLKWSASALRSTRPLNPIIFGL
jgi:hypothetical protein